LPKSMDPIVHTGPESLANQKVGSTGWFIRSSASHMSYATAPLYKTIPIFNTCQKVWPCFNTALAEINKMNYL
jgi:hypothetical protein